MQARKVCFNYDEVFRVGHWHKNSYLYAVSEHDDESKEGNTNKCLFADIRSIPKEEGMHMAISHQTLKLKGLMKKQSISILIDAGSTKLRRSIAPLNKEAML